MNTNIYKNKAKAVKKVMADWRGLQLAVQRENGYRNGRADKRIGIRSLFAWYCVKSSNAFEKAYGEGYREAWKKK